MAILTGTSGDDLREGTSLADVINGLQGNDTLRGAGGTDTLTGDIGNDSLDGGADNDIFMGFNLDGFDTLNGGNGTDTANYDDNLKTATLILDLITGTTLRSGEIDTLMSIEKVVGTDATNDTVNATDSATGMTINLNTGAVSGSTAGILTVTQFENINAGSGNDLLTGTTASNTLNGGEGLDTMVGGAGNDLYIVDNTGDRITEGTNAGTDTVQSSVSYTLDANIENLILTGSGNTNGTGNSLNNSMSGNSGNNSLDGGAGNDTLSGGEGNDTLTGGAGNDVYLVNSNTVTLNEASDGGTDTVQAALNVTLADNIENLVLLGTDSLTGTGNASKNSITGNSGNNTLDGGAGVDTMVGGLGDDTYIVDNSSDVVTEGMSAGIDTVQASVSYTLASNIERLILTGTGDIAGTGNTVANLLVGNSGNNTLSGGTGADTMQGGLGNDWYIVDAAGDVVTENASEGTDTVQSSISYTLGSNLENLTFSGTGGTTGIGNTQNNVITGNSGNNNFNGDAGSDTLLGNGGNDTLNGGLGGDYMEGGAGNDTYVVDDAGDQITELADNGTDLVQAYVSYTLGNNIEKLTLMGTDSIRGQGNSLANVLTGNAGNNTLDGGGGNDTMAGGLGDDTYIVNSSSDIISDTGGVDTVQSNKTYTLASNLENLILTGTGDLSGTGNTSNNHITGNSGDNSLNGAAGNDTLDGGTGADTMVGGAGNDTFIIDNSNDEIIEKANEGTDTIVASASYTIATNFENLTLTGNTNINATGNKANNLMTGNTGNNSLSGGEGNDTLDGGAGADTMVGGLGNDVYVVDNINDVIIEATVSGNDTVQASINYTLGTDLEILQLMGTADLRGMGTALNNTLIGNSGNNTLDGGAGNDMMSGGLGDDTYIVDNVSDMVSEAANAGTDSVFSSLSYVLGANVENLTLTGTSNSNGTGNASNNVMMGNSANNSLNGQGGADTLQGGDGNDVYIVDNLGDVVIENANEGTDFVQSSVSFTLGNHIENLTLTGTENINGTGGTGNNTLIGNSGNNSLVGGAGDDSLNGNAGADTMVGGTGNDTYQVDSASDSIVEDASAGEDSVVSSVSYTLGSNLENLSLTGLADIDAIGNTSDNSLAGNNGNNILDGGLGADTLSGGSGNDTYIVDNALDLIIELGTGIDTVQASTSYSLASNLEILILTGTGDFSATGNIGINSLYGNSGNNTLNGNVGADLMVGGQGNDVYIVDNAGDVVTENANEGTDTIQASLSYTLQDNVEHLILQGVGNFNAQGNSLNNSLTGNLGNNSLDGGLGADTMYGGYGNDTYIVDNTGDVATEVASGGTDIVISSVSYTLQEYFENLTLTGSGNLNAIGNTLDNVIIGNSGNNTLNGQGGADTLTGGGGDDVYVIDSSDDSITENSNEGTDTVLSTVSYTLANNLENLTLNGTAANGTGNSLNNVINGNASDNTLNGGAGADTLTGGAGNDTYFIDNIGDVITEGANAGTDTVQSTLSYTLAANFENLTLIGTDFVNGTGNSVNNIITGNNAGNTLDGGAGADTMTGRDGNDTYIVDNANDVVVEAYGGGTDTIQSNLSYTLSANLENLTLTGNGNINGIGNEVENYLMGNSGNNSLVGGGANDTLDGGAGNDTLVGGNGDNYYVVDTASDIIVENAFEGTDTVQAGISYTLAANLENLVLTGSSNINGIGNADNNLMTGNAGNNSLNGGAGNDTLNGGTGNDTMIGGVGNDIYYIDTTSDVITENVDEGTDTVQSSISWTLGSNFENLVLTGNNSINATGNTDNNIVMGNKGNNIINGGTGEDTMSGDDGNDTYYVDDIDDVVEETYTGGIDTILTGITYTLGVNVENLTLQGTSSIDAYGNTSNNVLTGNSGNNTLNGDFGADTLIGGAGNDTYIIDNEGDVIIENSGEGTDTVQLSVSYTLAANLENIILTGTSDISATGSTGNNLITGNSGNNTLDGGGGADTLVGGLGDDFYIVDSSTDVITENASEGTDTVQTNASYTLGNNIENLVLSGSANLNGMGSSVNNSITGNTGDNLIDGSTGADTLQGGGGNDTYVVDNTGDVIIENSNEGIDTVQSGVSFTLGNNIENLTLTGTTAISGTGNNLNNVITGNSGNNTLNGGTGSDTLVGGLGNDIFVVDSTTESLVENASEGTDTVQSSISWTLATNFENLTLTGNSAISGTGNSVNNTLTGNTGNNTLDGGAGIDTLIGGIGNDWYIIDSTTDILTENASEGTDTIQSSVTYTLGTNFENLVLTGTSALNGTGNTVDNSILGNSGSNSLSGGTGNDTLEGAAGNDTLVGGAGNDVYVIDTTSDVVTENASEGTDTVQSSVTYTLGTNVENLTLLGTAAINGVGNTLANTLIGNTGNNTLDGSTGNDTLNGGLGNDSLIGGANDDSYIGFAIGTGTDIIDDASGTNDTASFTGLLTTQATWTAVDGSDSDSYVDRLLINFGSGFTVTILNYFSNTSLTDNSSSAGSGFIEHLVFNNDSDVTFADVQALIP